jgi:2-polyprenyl-6-methoxyphenol hydroxylase-like FAD-dependent oxidoreductase
MDCDVVVVGAGPVGLTLALILHQLGHKVQVLERHVEHFKQPRAVGIYHQALRLYKDLGLFEEMVKEKAFQDVSDFLSDTAELVDENGQVLAAFPFTSATSRSGTASSLALHQPTYERVLEQACRDRGVLVQRGIEVITVEDLGDSVKVLFGNAVKGKTVLEPSGTVQAKFVAGCDGANSIVRRSAGITFIPLEGANSRWLVVDIIPKNPEAPFKWRDVRQARQYLDYRRPRTSVPSPLNRRRWEFMVLPEESPEAVVDDAFIWTLLGDYYGCTPCSAEIERKTVYPLKGGWVDTFVKGRIALAGDASHLAPQFLGQGLNSGLRDAKSLSWRLDFALKYPDENWAKLLQDYSTEQLGVTKVFVTAAIETEKLYSITDPAEARARNEAVKAGRISPPPNLEILESPGMFFKPEGLDPVPGEDGPGSLFMNAPVSKDDKQDLFDQVVGTGWVLIGVNYDPLAALSMQTVADYKHYLRGLAAHFGPGGLTDLSGSYHKWFSKHEAAAVLVRPDYYLFGIVKKRANIDTMIKAAIDHIRISPKCTKEIDSRE